MLVSKKAEKSALWTELSKVDEKAERMGANSGTSTAVPLVERRDATTVT